MPNIVEVALKSFILDYWFSKFCSWFQIPIKWPKSRDQVWKANIPHTHLAHEKSDQNWMVVKGEKIVFPGGGTHFHYGADKYIASLADVRLLVLTLYDMTPML